MVAAVPSPGTIPAMAEYQPGALTIASTVNIEIVDTVAASPAATWRMSQIDFVGKAPSIMNPGTPTANDLVAVFQVGTNLPIVVPIGNFGLSSGNMPVGGGTGTLLSKVSATNYAAGWINISSLLATTNGISLSGSTTVTIGIATAGISSSMIATNAVGNVQFRQGVAHSLVGVTGTATANVADIAASAGTQVMASNLNGTGISFIALTTSYLPLQFQIANLTANGILLANGTGTILGTNFGTSGLFLQGNGSASAPSFALVNLTSSITGTALLSNGGLGTNTVATGSLLYGSGNATTIGALAAGTAGFILQTIGSTAAPQWVGAGGVLLNTLTAAQLGSAVDTTSFTSRYSRYRITFENICPVSTALLTTSFNMQIATSGTTWVAASYLSNIQVNVGLTTVLTGTTSAFLLSGLTATTSVGTSTLYGVNGWVELTNPANGVFRKSIVGHLDYMTPGAVSTVTLAQAFPAGFWDGAASAITGLNFAFQTGNISTGTIRIYGIA